MQATAKELKLDDFIGEKLEKILVKYWDLSMYEDDEDVIENEKPKITQIDNIAFVFGDKAVIINFLDETAELTIEYQAWVNYDEEWTEVQDKIFTKNLGKKLIYLWGTINLEFDLDNNYRDMCIFSFDSYPDILVYASGGELKIFESHQVLVPPKS